MSSMARRGAWLSWSAVVVAVMAILPVVTGARSVGAGADLTATTRVDGAGAEAGPVLPITSLQAAQERSFPDWLEAFKTEAIAAGLSEAVVVKALAGIELLPIVVERDRSQPEFTMPLDQYLKRRVDRAAVRTAREHRQRHTALLRRVADAHGVPPSIVVAIWGLESNFGRFSGVRPTVATLATLAFDGRRPTLFRRELLDALRILERGDIALEGMRGSWAGAMGQPQFMPSTYLRYAEDFNGDGRRDIWSTLADVFASIANYLKAHGWAASERWGREVRISAAVRKGLGDVVPWAASGCDGGGQRTAVMPVARWSELGVRLATGAPLPAGTMDASLVQAGSRYFLVYRNYDTLLRYNCAHAYALSVGLLADRLH